MHGRLSDLGQTISRALGRTTGGTQPGAFVGHLRLAAVHRVGLFWQNWAYAVLNGAAAGGTHSVGLPEQNWAYSSETSPRPALEPTLARSGAGAACCGGAAAEGVENGSLCMGELITSSHAASPRTTTVRTASPTTSRTGRRGGAGEGGPVADRPPVVAVVVMITPWCWLPWSTVAFPERPAIGANPHVSTSARGSALIARLGVDSVPYAFWGASDADARGLPLRRGLRVEHINPTSNSLVVLA